MTAWTVLIRSLRHYWRTHLGVVLGAALGAMVLTGALLVGDSVKATLRHQAMLRVGQTQTALVGGERFFRAALAQEIGPGAAPILMLSGSVSRADGNGRANQVQVLGADPRFWQMAPSPAGESELAPGEMALNERLANQLGAKAGDALIVRVEKPGLFSRDAPLSGEENEVIALRLTVKRVVSDETFGRFSLRASQVPPFTAFLPLPHLQERLQFEGKANVLLDGKRTPAELQRNIQARWQLADASLELRELPAGGVELRTGRVFLDPPAKAAAPQISGRTESLTYLVNEIRSGERAIPYSMATAVNLNAAGLSSAPLRDDEAAISQWAADDLGIGPGAKVRLTYFTMGERRQLIEQSREFTVAAVIPMSEPQLNGSWMPDFPGLSDAENCRDWEPGFAMDLGKIRDQDEKYWDQYRGTPKVFVNLSVGQQMWQNRWGDLTSIRYPAGTTIEAVRKPLLEKLTPEQAGMSFLALRQQALAATDAPVDFGQLFLSFSFFLLVAAGVLTGLLFVFSLEQRNEQVGLLLALGWHPKQVRRLFLSEGTILAVIGSILGIAGAVVYTQLVLHALSTVWRGAVGGVEFSFSASPLTLVIGMVASIGVALFAMWLASRRQLRHSARELLAAAGALEMGESKAKGRRAWSSWISVFSAAAALVLLLTGDHSAPGIFFGAGGLLLISGLALTLNRLQRTANAKREADSLSILGQRNAARRRGRSLAITGVLASGVFMVVAVDSFRHGPQQGTMERRSGTGGFALVGESALPIYEDLNAPKGREAFGLDEKELNGVSIVPLRLREGDDASCLNLNRALQPRLLGVKPEELSSREAFRFAAPKGVGWGVLNRAESGAVPGVVDQATLLWALQKKLGDEIEYQDENGNPFKVRLVAALAGSMLQGSIVISEQDFIAKFPGQGGYRFFLIDAPAQQRDGVAQHLSRALQDRGFSLTPAARRLAEFQAVENTYLSIFQALGGLGLLLGSVGLAIIVARSVLERRREFGLLAAVGFRPRQLRQLVFAEHRWLIACGLTVGIVSALVAVWPQLAERASGFPWQEMVLLVLGLTLGSLFWTWLATRVSLRGREVRALSYE